MTLPIFSRISDPVGEWCEFHHNLNDISPERRVRQTRVLRAFEESCGDVLAVDAADIEAFMGAMIDAGYHPHTVVSYLRLIRPFLRWLWKHGAIDAERWLRLQDVRGPRGAYDGLPRPYNGPEMRRFWIELDQRYPWTRDSRPELRTPERGEFWVRRWTEGRSRWHRVYPYARRLQVEAIAALALYGGLRRDEIYRLAITEMHYSNECVRVTSRKGAEGHEKVRDVPMIEPMRVGVGNWIEFREQVLAPDHDFPWLCLWQGGGSNADRCYVAKPMSHGQFAALLGDIGRGWQFHRLRHTFATARYAAGMPVEILQATLGHARIEQTLGYTKINTDKLIESAKATDDRFLKAVQNGRPNPDATEEAA